MEDGLPPNLDPPKFPKDDKNVSHRKTPESDNARTLPELWIRKPMGIMSVNICRKEKGSPSYFITLSDRKLKR